MIPDGIDPRGLHKREFMDMPARGHPRTPRFGIRLATAMFRQNAYIQRGGRGRPWCFFDGHHRLTAFSVHGLSTLSVVIARTSTFSTTSPTPGQRRWAESYQRAWEGARRTSSRRPICALLLIRECSSSQDLGNAPKADHDPRHKWSWQTVGLCVRHHPSKRTTESIFRKILIS